MKTKLLWLIPLLLLLFPLPARSEEIASSAASAIVTEARNGTVLLTHDAHTPRPMASTTKVMTALLTLENASLDDTVTASRNAFGVPGTSIYLSEGETLTVRDLLTGLMLASGNDAAVALAEHVRGSVEEFCQAMTTRAAELGCTDTVFLTPHGLPMNGHFTTASDLAKIAREAMTHEFFRTTVSTTRASIPWEGRGYDRVLQNKNRLLTEYEGATGIKTGYTRAAGRCLVFGAKRDGLELIGVVLNCSDWFEEAKRLMDVAFERYEYVSYLLAGESVRALPVTNSDGQTVRAVAAQELGGAVTRDSLPALTIDLPDTVDAPVTAGQKLGTAGLLSEGKLIAEIPLIAEETVFRDDFEARWNRFLQQWIAH